MAHLVVPGSKLSVLGSVRRAAALRRAEEDGESDGAADAREPVHAPSDEAEGREPESLTAVWLDEQGQAIGSVLALKLPASELVEAFGPDGRIGAEPVAGDLLITHEPPAAARGLLLRHANETLMLDRSELARADALPGPPTVRSFPDAHRAFLYPVFSDGFLDDEEFFELVGDLADWIGRQPPFDGPELAGRFGMKAFSARAGPWCQPLWRTADRREALRRQRGDACFAGLARGRRRPPRPFDARWSGDHPDEEQPARRCGRSRAEPISRLGQRHGLSRRGLAPDRAARNGAQPGPGG